MSATTLLRLPTVLQLVGRGRTSAYEDIRTGLLTQPVRISKRCSAWPAHEVEMINRARIAGATNDDLRRLVDRLHAERQHAFQPPVEAATSEAPNTRSQFREYQTAGVA